MMCALDEQFVRSKIDDLFKRCRLAPTLRTSRPALRVKKREVYLPPPAAAW